MTAPGLPARLTVRQRDDGSFIATGGGHIPVLLVAKNRAALAAKLRSAQQSLDALYADMPDAASLLESDEPR